MIGGTQQVRYCSIRRGAQKSGRSFWRIVTSQQGGFLGAVGSDWKR